MLYAHSFSTIEKSLFQKLCLYEEMIEIDIHKIWKNEKVEMLCLQEGNKTLLYSFQKFEYYQQLSTFQNECNAVDLLANYAVQNGFEKIILITYPGAYFNAGNLFLQHKGFIEQKFVATGIPCTLLSIQGIGDAVNCENNLHQLFYDNEDNKYCIPQNSNNIIYSLKLSNLVEVIKNAKAKLLIGKYDVFDSLFTLEYFLNKYSNIKKIQRLLPVYLYFKTFMGNYTSLTMLELFLSPIMQMYKYRTEKEFGVQLHEDKYQALPTNTKKGMEHKRSVFTPLVEVLLQTS